MPNDRYSTYEAKARFSEVLKKVREGRTITVTYHGEPVAEIRPLDRHSGTLARVEWLESRGVVVPAGYVRSSDLWHLATALYLTETPGELWFLTLDARQREIAEFLGFPTE